MNLSQQSDKLQSVEKVIQFCLEKKKKKTGAYALIVPGYFLDSIFKLNSRVTMSLLNC